MQQLEVVELNVEITRCVIYFSAMGNNTTANPGFATHRMPPVLSLTMSSIHPPSAHVTSSPRPLTPMPMYRTQETLSMPLRLPSALNESNKFHWLCLNSRTCTLWILLTWIVHIFSLEQCIFVEPCFASRWFEHEINYSESFVVMVTCTSRWVVLNWSR